MSYGALLNSIPFEFKRLLRKKESAEKRLIRLIITVYQKIVCQNMLILLMYVFIYLRTVLLGELDNTVIVDL